jgi:hypothetical protein
MINKRICECGADFTSRHRLATSCCACSIEKAKEYGNRTGMTAASAAVAKAIKRGELTPANQNFCVDCGKQARDYDHRDYAKPLDVVPVCRSCNKLRGPGKPIQQPA